MHLNPFFATAAAAALIACPAIALAQGGATTTPTAPPPAASPPTHALPSIPKITGGPDIYDTLKSSGQFTILVKALDQTGLVPYLQKYPNFTFFAPTDAAFNALPPDVLSKLLAANDTAANQLQQILAYHLLTVPVDASKIRGAKGPVATAEKSTIMLDGSNADDLLVNSADIIQTDVRTTNGGIINVIDKVLVPPDSPYAAQLAPAPSPTPSPTPQAGATP